MKSEVANATVSPLIAAGSRFPVGTAEPMGQGLSPIDLRSFLLRGAEPLAVCVSGMGSTPKQTTPYDGNPGEESEDFTLPDFSP
ncbi:MAG: hypothetical protein GEU83_20190 [Pseudonocardiaceae bacterium]|nr:hypothetical protein [Pseudonocardiaceae bacterium]